MLESPVHFTKVDNRKCIYSIHSIRRVGTKKWIRIFTCCESDIQIRSLLHLMSFDLCNSLFHCLPRGIARIVFVHTTVHSCRFHLKNPSLLYYLSRSFLVLEDIGHYIGNNKLFYWLLITVLLKYISWDEIINYIWGSRITHILAFI